MRSRSREGEENQSEKKKKREWWKILKTDREGDKQSL